ncbi:ABC transporter permease, partial [Mangrovicoccus algicola]
MNRPPFRPSPRPGQGLAFLAALAAALGLIALPLGRLLATALGGDGAPVLEALSQASTLRALGHSLDSAACSAVLALAAGTAVALAVGLTDLRGKRAFTFLLLIPMMIPPHVTAIAWIQALGPSSPLLKTLGIAPPLGSPHPLYSRGGVIGLLAIQHMPLVFLVVLAALRALPADLTEAARIAGAGPGRLLRRILLPLLLPALGAGAMLAFVAALGNFGIPALLGIPGRYVTLPVLIWQRLASFGPSVLADVAAIAAILAAVALVAILVQGTILRRGRNALSGAGRSPLRLPLGRWRPAAEASLALLVLATLVLPLCALLATALVPTYGVALSAATLTLDNFAEVLLRQEVTARAFANSLLLALCAAA